MNKRVLSLVLVLAMVLGTFSFAFADEAKAEEPASNPKIDWLVQEGLVKGDKDGLRLSDTITRGEVAAMVVRSLDLEEVALASQTLKGQFKDVTPAHWANGYVNVSVGRNIVKGYTDGTFKPNNQITYAEIITMMVRVLDGMTAEEEKVAVYPTTYLAKAAELGILNGVEIANFKEVATREKVFEIVYNTVTNRTMGNYQMVEAIVLENSRVESIGSDQIVVEVIREMQRPEFAKESRKEKGDQLRLTLPKEVKDVEDLLGKVVEISFNKEGKVVDVKNAKGYEYKQGSLDAYKNKVKVDGKAYTVVLDERYKEKDDRLFRTYFNNKPYAYDDFYRDPATIKEKDEKRKDDFSTDYAKVTIKNGKVLFIDAFAFEDIAPVKEVKKDGAEVYVYNDNRDGGVKRLDLRASTKVLTVKDGVFNKGSIADIAANDVIHEFNGGYIVRKDAKVDGTYKKVTYTKADSDEKDNDVCVVVDDGEYGVLTAINKKPVYSYDSKDFYTLETRGIDKTLRDFKDEKVTVLLDISDNLQFITSEIELGEFVSLVDNIIGKEVRVLKGVKNDKAEYAATFDSDLLAEGTTRYQNLKDYNSGDIVYLSVDDDKIDTMLTLIRKDEKGIKVVKDAKGNNELTSRSIKTDKLYRILDRTNVFVRTADEVRSTTIDYILDNYKVGKDDDVKAIVLTDKQYEYKLTDKEVDFRRNTSDNPEVAHTIVFTDIERTKAKYDTEIVEILDKQASGRDYVLKVKFSNGEKAERTVVKTNIGEARVGDIVKLDVTKGDDKVVRGIKVLIPVNTKDIYKVVSIGSRTGYREIELEDKAGVPRTYWIYGEEFDSISRGDKVSIYDKDNTKKELDAIILRDKDEELGYWGTTPVETTTGVVTYINVDENLIKVDNKILELAKKVELLDANGKTLKMGKNEVIKYLDGLYKKGDVFLDKITEKDGVVTEMKLAKEKEPEEPEKPEKLTAEATLVNVAIIRKNIVKVSLSDSTKLDKVEKFVIDETDYAVEKVENGYVYAKAAFDDAPTSVIVVVEGQPITATIK